LPGEALDPLLKSKHHNPRDHRPSQPYETIINAAADVDEALGDANEAELKSKTKPVNTDVKTDKMEKYAKEEKKKAYEKKEKLHDVPKKENPGKEDWSMHKLNVPGREYVRTI